MEISCWFDVETFESKNKNSALFFVLLKCTKIGHNFDEKNSGVHVWSRGKKNGSKPLWCLLQIPVMDVAEFEPWSGSNIFSNRDKCRLTAAKYRFGYFGGKVTYSSKLAIQATKDQKARNNFEELHKKFNGFPTMQVNGFCLSSFSLIFCFHEKSKSLMSTQFLF